MISVKQQWLRSCRVIELTGTKEDVDLLKGSILARNVGAIMIRKNPVVIEIPKRGVGQ